MQQCIFTLVFEFWRACYNPLLLLPRRCSLKKCFESRWEGLLVWIISKTLRFFKSLLEMQFKKLTSFSQLEQGMVTLKWWHSLAVHTDPSVMSYWKQKGKWSLSGIVNNSAACREYTDLTSRWQSLSSSSRCLLQRPPKGVAQSGCEVRWSQLINLQKAPRPALPTPTFTTPSPERTVVFSLPSTTDAWSLR